MSQLKILLSRALALFSSNNRIKKWKEILKFGIHILKRRTENFYCWNSRNNFSTFGKYIHILTLRIDFQKMGASSLNSGTLRLKCFHSMNAFEMRVIIQSSFNFISKAYQQGNRKWVELNRGEYLREILERNPQFNLKEEYVRGYRKRKGVNWGCT